MANSTNVAKGTEYEQFVQAVYQAVINSEDVENITVQHNTKLTGKSGCEHQIDVYWEFRVAGQTYKTAIECKAFNETVSIGRVRDFYGVLVDVPGLSGIFATLVGYQSGAKRYADHYGITLKELRAPNETDWKGRVKTIVITYHVIVPEITKFTPQISKSFLDTLKPNEEIRIEAATTTHEKIIFGPPGSLSSYSLEDFRQLLPHGRENENGLTHQMLLPHHVYKAGGWELPIDGVDFTYDVNVEKETTTLDGAALAKAIIRDAVSGELKFIDKAGNVKSYSQASNSGE
ncbi:restriction endonuclease [Neorhizobium sp. BT27B]|uniref:restriction endonuclease n=1 Tax=Neorhizobium sp. BT27B TaxID=3142625 RepID=UPI003D274285